MNNVTEDKLPGQKVRDSLKEWGPKLGVWVAYAFQLVFATTVVVFTLEFLYDYGFFDIFSSF